MTEVLKRAIDTYGVDNQLTIAVEEFSELTKEICKYKRGEQNRAQIIEEMADCYIMLAQLEMIFGVPLSGLNIEIGLKIERLKHRLNTLDGKGGESDA